MQHERNFDIGVHIHICGHTSAIDSPFQTFVVASTAHEFIDCRSATALSRSAFLVEEFVVFLLVHTIHFIWRMTYNYDAITQRPVSIVGKLYHFNAV